MTINLATENGAIQPEQHESLMALSTADTCLPGDKEIWNAENNKLVQYNSKIVNKRRTFSSAQTQVDNAYLEDLRKETSPPCNTGLILNSILVETEVSAQNILAQRISDYQQPC